MTIVKWFQCMNCGWQSGTSSLTLDGEREMKKCKRCGIINWEPTGVEVVEKVTALGTVHLDENEQDSKIQCDTEQYHGKALDSNEQDWTY